MNLLSLLIWSAALVFLFSGIFSQELDNNSPLIGASNDGNVEDVHALLTQGYNPNVRNDAGWTPLISAVNANNPQLVQMLIESGAWINEPENDGWSPIFFATFKEQENIVDLLLHFNANPFQENKLGVSAFSLASERALGNVLDMIERYRIRREGVEVQNERLLEGGITGDYDIVRNALDEGAEVNVANVNGYTPLIAASRGGWIDCVKLLLERGANVHAKEQDGWSALTFASATGNFDIVNVLLEAGAVVLHISHNGITIPGPALMNGHNELAMYLTNEAIPEAMRIGDGSRLLDLVESGGNVNAKNLAGWTPLIYFVSSKDVNGIERTLIAGANVDEVENDGWTPLMFAAAMGNAEVTKTLLDHGADPKLKALDGKTALQRAEDGNFGEVSTMISNRAATLQDNPEKYHGIKSGKGRASMESNARAQAEKEAAEEVTNEKNQPSGGFFGFMGF